LLSGDLWRRRSRWLPHRFTPLLIVYAWLIHMPMSIQSRYSVSVHRVVFFCCASMFTRPSSCSGRA
jgi:hypothetical protein